MAARCTNIASTLASLIAGLMSAAFLFIQAYVNFFVSSTSYSWSKATEYAAEDADVTLRLWMLLKPRLAAERLRPSTRRWSGRCCR